LLLRVEVLLEAVKFAFDCVDLEQFRLEQFVEAADLGLYVALGLLIVGLKTHLALDHLHLVVDEALVLAQQFLLARQHAVNQYFVGGLQFSQFEFTPRFLQLLLQWLLLLQARTFFEGLCIPLALGASVLVLAIVAVVRLGTGGFLLRQPVQPYILVQRLEWLFTLRVAWLLG